MADHLKEYFLSQGRKWIILFPEGGFLRKRLETSQRSEQFLWKMHLRTNDFVHVQMTLSVLPSVCNLCLSTLCIPVGSSSG